MQDNSSRLGRYLGLCIGLVCSSIAALLVPTAAHATSGIAYVEVSFESVGFSYLGDGTTTAHSGPYVGGQLTSLEHASQVYGRFSAESRGGPIGPIHDRGFRSLGHWEYNNCGRFSAPLNLPGCPIQLWDREFLSSNPPPGTDRTDPLPTNTNAYRPEDFFFCDREDDSTCGHPLMEQLSIQNRYRQANNKIVIKAAPGEFLGASVRLMDYGELNANDDICWVGVSFGPYTADQLKTLNSFGGGSYSSDHKNGACMVTIRMRTVKVDGL